MFEKSNPFAKIRSTIYEIVGLLKEIQKVRIATYEILAILKEHRDLGDLYLFDRTRQIQYAHPNPLNKFGKKCFSQTDEDGITIEILRRLELINNGVYAEYGVGNGTENNTLILAALGWKGFWVGVKN